jgi:hypothetical protein
MLKGSQALGQVALRKRAMASIHDGYCGIVKCVERAKMAVY